MRQKHRAQPRTSDPQVHEPGTRDEPITILDNSDPKGHKRITRDKGKQRQRSHSTSNLDSPPSPQFDQSFHRSTHTPTHRHNQSVKDIKPPHDSLTPILRQVSVIIRQLDYDKPDRVSNPGLQVLDSTPDPPHTSVSCGVFSRSSTLSILQLTPGRFPFAQIG